MCDVINTCLRKTDTLFEASSKKCAELSNLQTQRFQQIQRSVKTTHTPRRTQSSSARTWYVINMSCSQKIHRHYEMPKLDSIMSCLRWVIMTYLRGSQFQRAVKEGSEKS